MTRSDRKPRLRFSLPTTTTVEIDTSRFVLRELTPGDVSQRYLSWLSDPDAKAHIRGATSTRTLDDLRTYVEERSGRDDVLFLGVFDKATGWHIGNVKYEPVDSRRGYAIMGMLIGDPGYRGKGVATEVLRASGRWLKERRGIREIVLGVHRSNPAAIHAYEKAGFRVAHTPHIPHVDADSVTMVWVL